MAGFYKDYDAQDSQGSDHSFWSPTRNVKGRGRMFGSDHGRYAGLGLTDEGQEQVEQLFNNVIRFRGNHWKLPEAGELFYSKPEDHEKLAKLAERLSQALEHGQQFEQHLWEKHLHFMHKGGIVLPKIRSEFEPELCVSTWLDMQLILWTFSLIPAECSRLQSLHLYDASGARIASLNQYLKSHRSDCEWAWKGMSWNPYFEGHDDESLLATDRFINETQEQWYFGTNDSGDIRREENREGLGEFAKGLGEINLITAHGELSDSAKKDLSEELLSASKMQLTLAQVVVTLKLLSPGGGFVLQVDDLINSHTMQLTFLLVSCFHEVNVFKPATASSFDQRFYFVCLSYAGTEGLPSGFLKRLIKQCELVSVNRSLFPVHAIPDAFIKQYLENVVKMTEKQLLALKEVADLFDSMRKKDKDLINEVKTHAVDRFKTLCKLKKLSQDKRVIKHVFLDGTLAQLSRAKVLAPEGGGRKTDVSIRSPNLIIASLEDQVKQWTEDDYYSAVAKKPKMEEKRGFSSVATKFVTSQVFWEGDFSLAGSPADIDPEGIKWLQDPHGRQLETVSARRGTRLTRITNSPFCPTSVLWKLQQSVSLGFGSGIEKVKKLRAIEAQFSAAYWFREVGKHFLGQEGLLMASIDLLGHVIVPLISESKTVYGSEPLEFLDLTGAPSGFAKYICFRTQDAAKGWGIVRSESPKVIQDPEMELYNSWQTFRTIGSPHGIDVTQNDTISMICEQLKGECPSGVRLVIGDSSCGTEIDCIPCNEELQTKIYFLSMCQIMFQALMKGGTFICKIYDMFSRFTVGLLFLLYRSFKEITVMKPFMAPPSSADKYLICKGFLGIKSVVLSVLEVTNEDIHDLETSGSSHDILEVVPMALLFEENFFQYIYNINQQFAKRRQAVISALEHIFDNADDIPSDEMIGEYQMGALEVLGITEMTSN